MNKTTDLNKSEFVSKYMKEMCDAIGKMHPEWKRDDIYNVVYNMVEEQFTNPSVIMDNNVIHARKNASLLSVVDWFYERKPILAGNGTFYKDHHEAINPTGRMLEGWGTQRSDFKYEMFQYEESTPQYKACDLKQVNKKILMNSYYGGSGLPVSDCYSQWSGPATTLTAQSVISTTECAFEGFLADNYLFLDMNELIDWAKCVLKEDYEIDDFVKRISEKQLLKRLKTKFYVYHHKFDEALELFVNSLSEDERTKIYYKNNIREFTLFHDKIQSLYKKVFKNVRRLDFVSSESEIPKDLLDEFLASSKNINMNKLVKEYNKWVCQEKFYNPNKVPKDIKPELEKLCGYYIKYCHVKYLSVDRIYRLKFFKRKAVVIVDTDSNMLNCKPWVDFLNDKIFNHDDFGRGARDNDFIAVNSIAYILTAMVTDLLLYYGKKSNIPKEFRHKFNMKNEFLFMRLIITKKKKRYLSSIALREGNLYNPLRIDEKGLDYIKSGTSETAMERYRELTVKYLLDTDVIDPKGVYRGIQDFKNEIYESLHNGEKTYLPNASAKEPEAYKNPWSNQTVRAIYAWDALYPSMSVSTPSKINIVKLNIFSLKDIEPLKTTHPEVYETIKNDIFGSPNEKIASKGCQVLAIPGNVARIPEWAIDYIDYRTMTSDILSSFTCIMDAIKFKTLDVGKTSTRKSKTFTNIIHF